MLSEQLIQVLIKNNKTISADSSELKIIKYVNDLANYINWFFVLTKTAETNMGIARNILGWIPTATTIAETVGVVSGPTTEFQGLTHKEVVARYKAATDIFNSTKAWILNLKVDNNFNKLSLKTTVETSTNFSHEATGKRFKQMFTAWLDLIDHNNVDNAKQFIHINQLLLKNVQIKQNELMQHLGSIALKKPISFETPSGAVALFVRGELRDSIFDALGHQAIYQYQMNEIPEGIMKDIKKIHLQLAELSTQIYSTFPTDEFDHSNFAKAREHVLRAIYSMLNVFAALHQPLHEAAKKKANTEAAHNFQLHCAILQTILLVLADNKPKDKEANFSMHWKEQTQGNFKALIKTFTDKYVDLTGSQKIDAIPFMAALAELQSFTSQIAPDPKNSSAIEFDPKNLANKISAYLTGRSHPTEFDGLALLLARYVQGLGGLLQNTLEEFKVQKQSNDKNPVLDAFEQDPNTFNLDLASEMVKASNDYISNNTIKDILCNRVEEEVHITNHNNNATDSVASYPSSIAAETSGAQGSASASASAASVATDMVVIASTSSAPKNTVLLSQGHSGAANNAQKKNQHHSKKQ